MSPNDVLGVPAGATHSEVRRAFRRYALRHHPDRGGSPERFQAGEAAYRTLLAGTPADRGGAVVFHRRARGWRTLARRIRRVAALYRDVKERA